MLHYNFPPYSVGEVGRFGLRAAAKSATASSPGARCRPVLPTKEEFPYTIRVVSDITESNGSSSMATVCGGSLVDDGRGRAAEASGVGHRHGPDPRRRQVRRAVRHPGRRGSPRRHGLQGGRHQSEGITTMQMDIKIAGITEEIFKAALAQAKEGRAHILGEMTKALGEARSELSAHAPRIETIQIDKSKIRDVIGTGGKVIREIVAKNRRQGRHRRRRHGSRSARPTSSRSKRRRLDPRHRRGSRSRQDLQRQGCEHRRFRRVRELHGRQGRPRPRLRDANERVEKPTDVVSEGQEVKVKVLEIDRAARFACRCASSIRKPAPSWKTPVRSCRAWGCDRRRAGAYHRRSPAPPADPPAYRPPPSAR
jgi:polyribonucleotide nucleotidyltransferase